MPGFVEDYYYYYYYFKKELGHKKSSKTQAP
jgi:hypothetical protein